LILPICEEMVKVSNLFLIKLKILLASSFLGWLQFAEKTLRMIKLSSHDGTEK